MEITSAQRSKVHLFRELHTSGCFVLPNPWDAGTARYLDHLGFKALATTSAGFAFTRAHPDGAVPLDEMLAHIEDIVSATTLPVNADFLNGFADEPEQVADSVRRCLATGVAGLSIEDSTGRNDPPLYEKSLAVERIVAARRAIDASDIRVALTARCEAYLVGDSNPLATALDRLTAFAEAGADCLYAPGVVDPEEISALVQAAAPKPINILVSGFNAQLSFAQLAKMGVRRISVGSGFALVAWGAFIRSAQEIAAKGRFDSLASGAKSAELNGLFQPSKPIRQ
jgi:2-methylisocitrate lyase-like PEP mutase family enzyme